MVGQRGDLLARCRACGRMEVLERRPVPGATPPDTPPPDRTVQTVPTVQTVRITPEPNGSHGSNTPNGSTPTPTCPVCGGPNSSTRDDAGLDCLDCYARGAA